MPDSISDARLEIAHVLFMDIVGWSKLLINEQSELLRKLNEIVRNTAQVRAAEAAGRLIRLPTGDGMALAFFTTPDAPVRCAIEIGRQLRDIPNLGLRMGVHSGPVDEVVDVNERANIAGAGITIAQRVMDCGDAGHILLSKRAADDLGHYAQWRSYLHELGECEVKHSQKIGIFNFYTEDVGNPGIPSKIKSAKSAEPVPAVPSPVRRRNFTIAGLVLLGAGLISILLWSRLSHPTGPVVAAAEKRMAVLPFKPLSRDNRDEALELGMADTLIAKLSSSRSLIVPSLNSVRRYSGIDQDPVAAGRELQTNSVLEGNVQKAGDRIRVTARLIKVADGSAIWAGTFDEKFTDVFAVQDAISQKVADALSLQLSGDERARLTKRYTENIQAYQLYLIGRYYWNKLRPPDLTKSIEIFNQAITLDPAYAPAYFGLAEAYRSLSINADVPSKECIPQSEAAARKALELDPSLAEAHASLAFNLTWFDWDWAEAEKEAKRSTELKPNWGFAHSAYAHLLSVQGRHEEAIAEGARASDLDPTSLIINTIHGFTLYQAGRGDEARAIFEKTLELDPNFWIARLFLGRTYLNEGKYEDAITELTKASQLSGGNSETTSMIGYSWMLAGDMAKGRLVLDELKSLASRRYVAPSNVALLCYAVGEKDEAFTWLEKAYQDHDVRLCRLQVDPAWKSVRSDPRFGAIMRRIGLQ